MKILVAIDLSEASRRAYEFAISIAQTMPNCSLVLVSAVELAVKGSEKAAHNSATAEQWEESDAKGIEFFNKQRTEKLQKLILSEFQECTRQKFPCSTHIEVGDPREIIMRTIKEQKADLLVMGSRGLSPLIGLQLGSVSDYCVRNAPIPVTVVK